jgi:hypothetical protein
MSGSDIRPGERFYRYEVLADYQWHDLELHGDPLHVAMRDIYAIEFWARWSPSTEPTRRRFQVIGTGRNIPPGGCRYWGSGVMTSPSLVWHLIEGD